jgi:hypothetical protein
LDLLGCARSAAGEVCVLGLITEDVVVTVGFHLSFGVDSLAGVVGAEDALLPVDQASGSLQMDVGV